MNAVRLADSDCYSILDGNLIVMKPSYLMITTFILAGCIKNKNIEFTGITPGITSGVFIVKTKGDSTVYGENIKDGKFALATRQLKYPGYYSFNIIDNDHPDNRPFFEIYLEGGKYTVQTEPGKLYNYPKIKSDSKIQNDLSAYYTLSDKVISAAREHVNQLNNEVNNKGNGLSKAAYSSLLNKLSTTENKMNDIGEVTLKQFVKDYPNSLVSIHIMAGLNYEADPVSYYTIFKRLPPEARNSEEGKEVGDRLSHLIKLVAGANAPIIYGKTPNGKIFDRNTINKKLILIDFWRAGNDFSRQNHQKLIDVLSRTKNKDSFGIVSVSMDTKADWWTTAITDDHLTWPQVSDLKGDDSPNAVNWSITKIPTYYLVDSRWNIIERDLDMGNIDFEINDYLKKHP